MTGEPLHYTSDNVICHGRLFRPENGEEKTPAILIAHAWRGIDDFAIQKGKELSQEGYYALAVDLYGAGRKGESDEEAYALMLPLFLNRKVLQERMGAALDALLQVPYVDPSRIGAIGFCFGGLTVIDFLLSGAMLRGAVSFHGLFSNTLNGQKATLGNVADTVKGSLLLLHGYKDPLVTEEDSLALQRKLDALQVDWQLHVYGRAMHAFTNPQAASADAGLLFNEQAAKRSWLEMKNFFKEIF